MTTKHPHEHDDHGRSRPEPAPATRTTAAVTRDPVCGMHVAPGEAAGGSAQHGGRTYWFCSPVCRERFVADPERYAALVSSPPASRAAAVAMSLSSVSVIANALRLRRVTL